MRTLSEQYFLNEIFGIGDSPEKKQWKKDYKAKKDELYDRYDRGKLELWDSKKDRDRARGYADAKQDQRKQEIEKKKKEESNIPPKSGKAQTAKGVAGGAVLAGAAYLAWKKYKSWRAKAKTAKKQGKTKDESLFNQKAAKAKQQADKLKK